MQGAYGGMAPLLMRPGVVSQSYGERRALLVALRGAACHRASVKVGQSFCRAWDLTDPLLLPASAAYTCRADAAAEPSVAPFDEDRAIGEGSEGWAYSDSEDDDSEDDNSGAGSSDGEGEGEG